MDGRSGDGETGRKAERRVSEFADRRNRNSKSETLNRRA